MAHRTLQRHAHIAYVDQGAARPGVPPLLLVHGWAARANFFTPQIDAFAATTRVIAPDLAGHGDSRRPGAAPTIGAMADDLASLLAALDLEGVLAVGWSMGASVLWELMARPGATRLAGLMAVDMTPRVLNDADWKLGLADGLTKEDSQRAVDAMRADWAKFSERVAGNVFAPDASPEIRARWSAAAFADNDAEAMAKAWESLTTFDARPLIAKIAAPMLIAYGAHSKLYAPATSAWLADAAPHAARIAFAHSGHAPHLEEPERFNRVLTQFAALLSGKDATGDVKQLGRDAATVI